MIENIYIIVLLLLCLQSFDSMGHLMIKGFKINLSMLNTKLLSVTLGVGGCSVLIFILGHINALYPTVIWTILFFFILVNYFFNSESSLLIKLIPKVYNFYEKLEIEFKIFFVLFIFLAFCNFIASLTPPVSVDDLIYHFSLPKKYIQSNGIHPIKDFRYSSTPMQMEMLWTFFIGLKSGILAQVFNWVISILICGWIYLIGVQAKLNKESRLTAILLFYSISIMSSMTTSGSIELGACLFLIAGVNMYFNFIHFKRIIYFLLSSFFIGIFAATKLPFLPIAILIASILIIFFKSENDFYIFKSRKYNIIVFYLLILMTPSLWFAKSFFEFGNPVFPFLTTIFSYGTQLDWNLVHQDSYSVDNRLINSLKNLKILFYQIWYLIADIKLTRGSVSPLFISLIPITIINYKYSNKFIKSALLISLGYYILWVLLYPITRIALPMFAIFSIPISLSLYTLGKKDKILRLFLNFFLLLSISLGCYSSLRNLIPKIPVAFGVISKETYLSSDYVKNKYNFKNFKAIDYMNKNIPNDSKVLLWSNDGYYLDYNYTYSLGFILIQSNQDSLFNKETVISELKKHGITHIAVTDNYLRKELKDLIYSSGKYEQVYKDDFMTISRLLY